MGLEKQVGLQKHLNVLNVHPTPSSNSLTWNDLHFDVKNHKVNSAEILVKKIENEIEKMINDNVKNSGDKSGKEKAEKERRETNKEFNLDLRVGKVESIIDHPNADKLYLLKVNLGKNKEGKPEIRQLVGGIRAHFKKEDVLGKNLVIVCNLAHAKLKGETSEGMLLAAKKEYVDKSGVKKEKLALLSAPNSKQGDRVYPDGEKEKLLQTFKTITYNDFQKYRFDVKNKEVFWVNKEENKTDNKGEKKALRTDKEKIKVDIDDGAEVC